MSLKWNEQQRRYEWEGDVRGLVNAVGDGDARLGFVLDKKSGAKIAMNISGADDPEATEPFNIESPDGDNMYDALNRKEAVMILSNIRRGEKYPDMPVPAKSRVKYKASHKSKKAAVRQSPFPGIGSVRGSPFAKNVSERCSPFNR